MTHVSMTPADVSQLANEKLVERVRLIASDPAAITQMEAIVPFATYGLVYRVHEEVARLNASNQLVWSKQATVGRALGSITGVTAKHALKEWEYIGNAVDARLRHYCRDLSKTKDADKKRAQRALKSGSQSLWPSRVAGLQERLYVCEYGGTPLKVPVHENRSLPCRQLSINRQPIPYRACGVGEVLTECERVRDKQRVHLQEERSTLLSLERDARKAINDADWAREKCKQSEERASAAAAILHAAAMEAHTKVEESKQQMSECERQRKQQEGKVFRLQGQLTRALREAEDEHSKRQRAQQLALKDLEALKAEVDAARVQADASKERVKEVRLLCRVKEGEVLRIEGKLVQAWQEAERQHTQNQEIAKMAQAELDAVRAVMCTVKHDFELCKQQKRMIERESSVKDGELFRLQGKLGRSMQDAARAKDEAERTRSTLKKKQSELLADIGSLESQLCRARELKNQMARRIREVRSKEAISEQQSEDLHKCRKRVRELNKEVNKLKTELCQRDGAVMILSDEEDSASIAESSSDGGEESTTALESRAAAEALQKIRSMPTWRATRGQGKGRGAPKIDWGVRLVIYALLALMVPPSAIGMIIVLIVQHAVPWLKPQGPTVNTVQRCRFELRFVEETLAARRVASAYRVRSIGFDETTKLGNSSLTSNVQIEPTQGAKLQDVILRAAYCPMGGTSDLCVQSIEQKCFVRLRDLLRRWKEKFVQMFPGDDEK